MFFEFNLVNTQRRDSALYLTDMEHSWPGSIGSKTISQKDLAGNVKGRATYYICDAMDAGFTREMFEENNLLMVADRVPEITAAPWFWSNIVQAHAIACDWWTFRTIKEYLPKIETRFLNLTGVNMCSFMEDNEHRFDTDVEPNDGIVYASESDSICFQLQEYINHTAFRDRKDGSKIKVESIDEANQFHNYNVLIAPYAHSSLWLAAMAHRSNLVLHEFEPNMSYHLDPRGNSTTISTLVAEKRELSGGTAFKRRIETLMDEYPGILESFVNHPYKRPKGDLLVDRLFAEVNRSGY